MREIKFRGKRLDTGEWVYGSLRRYETECYIMPLDQWGSGLEVDPATVGQYIGLTDRTDADTYEGDIVKDSANGGWDAEIIWSDTGWELSREAPNGRDLWELYERNRLLVIGNTHDNPELIR